jgi:hypothetical protein
MLTKTKCPLNILVSLLMAFAANAHLTEGQFRHLEATLNKLKSLNFDLAHVGQQSRKMYGSYARKFNSEKLKNPETSSAYREKLNEHLAKHTDNDDINRAWMLLKNAITQTADTVLDRMERVTYKD